MSLFREISRSGSFNFWSAEMPSIPICHWHNSSDDFLSLLLKFCAIGANLVVSKKRNSQSFMWKEDEYEESVAFDLLKVAFDSCSRFRYPHTTKLLELECN